jgi:hypothetical protein
MRLLSLVFYFLVLLPIGYARKVLRYSAFTQPAYRRTSSWNSARTGHKQCAPGRSRMDEQPAPAGQK